MTMCTSIMLTRMMYHMLVKLQQGFVWILQMYNFVFLFKTHVVFERKMMDSVYKQKVTTFYDKKAHVKTYYWISILQNKNLNKNQPR